MRCCAGIVDWHCQHISFSYFDRASGILRHDEELSKSAHQEILQQGAALLGAHVDAPSEVRGLLKECRVAAGQHACIHHHLAPLHAHPASNP